MEILEIKQYLKKYKITYAQVADLTGLNLTTIKRIFSGQIKNPHIETMRAIEQALGFTGGQTPTAAPLGEVVGYSSEERKLIEEYRELNQSGKRLINETVKTLLTTSAGSEQKKKEN